MKIKKTQFEKIIEEEIAKENMAKRIHGIPPGAPKKRDGGKLGRFLGGDDFELRDDEPSSVLDAIKAAIKAKLKKRAEKKDAEWEEIDASSLKEMIRKELRKHNVKSKEK
jgi:hypothetical protein